MSASTLIPAFSTTSLATFPMAVLPGESNTLQNLDANTTKHFALWGGRYGAVIGLSKGKREKEDGGNDARKAARAQSKTRDRLCDFAALCEFRGRHATCFYNRRNRYQPPQPKREKAMSGPCTSRIKACEILEKALFLPDLGAAPGRAAMDVKGVPPRERLAREASACAFLGKDMRSKGEFHEVPRV